MTAQIPSDIKELLDAVEAVSPGNKVWCTKVEHGYAIAVVAEGGTQSDVFKDACPILHLDQ